MGLALELIKRYEKSYDKFVKDQEDYNNELIDDMDKMIRDTVRMPKGLKTTEYKK